VNLRQAAARAANAVRRRREARERQASADEADRLWAIADELDRQQGHEPGYQHQLAAERAARIQAWLDEDLVRDARGQAAAAAAGEPLEHWAISADDVAPTAQEPTPGPRGHGLELEGDELDAEIDRLAAQYPEPCMGFGEEVRLAQGPEAWEALKRQYQRETGAPDPDRDTTVGSPDDYRSTRGSAEHREAQAEAYDYEPEMAEPYTPQTGAEEAAEHEAAGWYQHVDPVADAPDYPYGAPQCADADPETAHLGSAPGEPQDAERWSALPLAEPAAGLQGNYGRLHTPQHEAEAV
jgi:hypothetical protein